MEEGKTQEERPKVRVRGNVSTTSKGLYSWEHTVEVTGDTESIQDMMDTVMRTSDEMELRFSSRYASRQGV